MIHPQPVAKNKSSITKLTGQSTHPSAPPQKQRFDKALLRETNGNE